MAYNKSKHAESAQRYLNQGKIVQAIAEYQQILRREPKDQVTLMTIGDLYVRQGETFQAVEYFERLAQVYLGDGFAAKAIAIYKKIAKLAPEQSRPVERLAELYVQQGVLSEARPIFLQLAEGHLRGNRQPQAIAVLRRLLEVEPDNLRVQTRLADLYHAIGRDKEAVEAYVGCAQHLIERGEHTESEKLADRALKLDAQHEVALTVKARALIGQGKPMEGIQLLESLPGSDSGTETTDLLLDVYLQNGKPGCAVALARRVFECDPKKYALAYKVATTLVVSGEMDQALELLSLIRAAMTDAGDHDQLAQVLSRAAGRLPRRLEPLEWLVDLYGQTSDSFRLPDALAQLGEAAAAAGQFERAVQVYEQLLDKNPEDEGARRRLNQVRTQMGLEPHRDTRAPRPVAVAPQAPTVSEARPVATVVEGELDEETQRYVAQSLTDVDLFSSYGLTQKAIKLLETVLERVPNHAVTLERLLDLYLGAGNERRTAELAAQLEQVHRQQGDAKSAERFAELHRRFQRAADLTAEQLPAAPPPEEFAVPATEVPAAPSVESLPLPEKQVEVVPSGEAAVHEVDLSEEWAALTAQREQAIPAQPAETPTVTMEVEPVEVLAEAPAAEAAVLAPSPAPSVPEQIAAPAAEKTIPCQGEPAVPAPAAEPELADQFVSELVAELEAGVQAPDVAGPPAEAAPATAEAMAEAPAGPAEAVEPLREVFEEFRAELGELGVEEEDPETHYNLGVAYREMGLLDEAIGEFQKVAQAGSAGRPFRYAMQCCTLLGLAFMEKGQPGIAAMWYERALETPGLDQESILALRYDLGVAQELAGDAAAALKSFSQVYAVNIDYRDVSQRIAELEKRR